MITKTKKCKNLFTSKRPAFTLAEVLITLGIIGVVAALTFPTLIQNHKNKEVESKLEKIYTVMNQAIMMSELDNGPKEYWNNVCSYDDEGNANEDCYENFDKYFLKYLKYLKTENTIMNSHLYTIIYMNDGSLLLARYNRSRSANGVIDFTFYPNAKNFTTDSFMKLVEDGSYDRPDLGISAFQFLFVPGYTENQWKYHYKKGFEPYAYDLNEYTKEEMTSGSDFACNPNAKYKFYCTALIRLNGWKIPKDYPFKVK